MGSLPGTANERQIASFLKSRGNSIRAVSYDRLKKDGVGIEQSLFDIRSYFVPAELVDDPKAEWIATKKGVTLDRKAMLAMTIRILDDFQAIELDDAQLAQIRDITSRLGEGR